MPRRFDAQKVFPLHGARPVLYSAGFKGIPAARVETYFQPGTFRACVENAAVLCMFRLVWETPEADNEANCRAKELPRRSRKMFLVRDLHLNKDSGRDCINQCLRSNEICFRLSRPLLHKTFQLGERHISQLGDCFP